MDDTTESTENWVECGIEMPLGMKVEDAILLIRPKLEAKVKRVGVYTIEQEWDDGYHYAQLVWDLDTPDGKDITVKNKKVVFTIEWP